MVPANSVAHRLSDPIIELAAQRFRALGEPMRIARTKRGTHASYSISDPSVFELGDLVCAGVRRHLQELETSLQPS